MDKLTKKELQKKLDELQIYYRSSDTDRNS